MPRRRKGEPLLSWKSKYVQKWCGYGQKTITEEEIAKRKARFQEKKVRVGFVG